LLGLEADPVNSRDHILLSSLLGWAWARKEDLTLESLIHYVQKPPMPKIGVLDLETFYPEKERFGLVVALNNLLAAPGFAAWIDGEPLDIGAMLHTAGGKPRHCIFSITHLTDAERMFFVSLLLSQVLSWMRTQKGTSSLRAILYMDEVFGYFPPVANPPSKPPLLRLIKQARAFGLGVVLATQNPADLDYKALSNAGTWFLGRLQTERDKDRVLEGLEGAAAAASATFNRKEMEAILSGLGQRIFVMNNVHDDEPVVFQTRWAMSYLRGPITGPQIKALMDPLRKPSRKAPPREAAAQREAPAAGPRPDVAAPSLAPDVAQYFAPVRSAQPAGSSLVYQPHLIGVARVAFADAKAKVDSTQELTFLAPVSEEPIPVRWESAVQAEFSASDLEKSPAAGGGLAALPEAATRPRSYGAWEKDFAAWVYGNQRLTLWRSPGLKQLSQPGESERDFRVRLQQAAREQRDRAGEALRQKYAPKIAALQERLRRAQQSVARETEQAKQQKTQTAISFGATLLGAFVGRRAVSATTLGRATTAARGVSRTMKEKEDIGRAQETVESLEARLGALEEEFQAETEALETKMDPQTEELETLTLRPKKADISIALLSLAWVPFWQGPGGESPAFR
jgi:hypothetical protein